jgi:hypothetical protein
LTAEASARRASIWSSSESAFAETTADKVRDAYEIHRHGVDGSCVSGSPQYRARPDSDPHGDAPARRVQPAHRISPTVRRRSHRSAPMGAVLASADMRVRDRPRHGTGVCSPSPAMCCATVCQPRAARMRGATLIDGTASRPAAAARGGRSDAHGIASRPRTVRR